MEERRDPLSRSSTPGAQASAASRLRSFAVPACRAASAALPCSDDVSAGSTTPINRTSCALPTGGRGVAVANSSARGRDCSPPLVTRSVTAHRPPGAIITRQVLVRLKPCTADTSGVDSSSNSGTGSGSRDGPALGTVKNSSGRNHNGGGSSSCIVRRGPPGGVPACSGQANSQREAVVSAGCLKARGETTAAVCDVTTTHKTSAPATGAPATARASHLYAGTELSATCDSTGTSAAGAATRDTVAGQVFPGKATSDVKRKKMQETEAFGGSAASAAAVNVSNSPAEENSLRSETTSVQTRLQEQDVQKQPECPQPPLQEQTPEQQRHALQGQAFSDETHLTKREKTEGSKADATTKTKPRTKVVVRLLPPSVTEEELLALVPAELMKQITWKKFYPGSHSTKAADGGGANNRTSVWFLNCTSAATAEELIKTFHSKCFVDERHTTFKAIAGFAPYQKTPRKKTTERRLEGQIEEEPLYVSFLEGLKDGGSADANRTTHTATEELEILRDDEGAPITAMLLEMREKYNVKTTVNGRLYTLAMWREDLSLSVGERTDA